MSHPLAIPFLLLGGVAVAAGASRRSGRRRRARSLATRNLAAERAAERAAAIRAERAEQNDARERAAIAAQKAAMEREAMERAAAQKIAMEREAMERAAAAAERAAAAAERAAAQKAEERAAAAYTRAAAERKAMEMEALERAAAQKIAMEREAMERAAAQKVAMEREAMERAAAAAERAAAQKTAVERSAKKAAAKAEAERATMESETAAQKTERAVERPAKKATSKKAAKAEAERATMESETAAQKAERAVERPAKKATSKKAAAKKVDEKVVVEITAENPTEHLTSTQTIFQPTYKTGLVIVNSEYKTGTLGYALMDGQAIQSWMKGANFDTIKVLENNTAEEITNNLNELENEVVKSVSNGAKGLVFVYYSGHSCVSGAFTEGIDKNGKTFILSQKIDQMLMYKNHYTIGFFDGCRSIGPSPAVILQGYEGETYGQSCIIYGSKPGNTATAVTGSLSHATKAFMQLVATTNETFPKCILSWQAILQHKLDISIKPITKKMEVILSPKMTKVIKGVLTLPKKEENSYLVRKLLATTISSYKPKQLLGLGSSGAVFLCEVQLQNTIEKVAVKMIFNSFASTLTTKTKYEKEKAILCLLPFHMNIIQIAGQYSDKPNQDMLALLPPDYQKLTRKKNFKLQTEEVMTTHFIVMEAHKPFITYYQQNASTMSFTQTIWICSEIASAISFLWENKIVHRDIKIENLLMSYDGFPILCDFGLAEYVDENGFVESDVKGGNEAHIAPEIHKLWKRNTKVNYSKQPSWELGIICFEIATGEHPCDNYPNVQIPQILDLKGINYPKKFLEIIQNLLKNQPEERMSIANALEQLQNL